MQKEIFLHKNYFDTTIRNAKTGNRTENRTPDQPEISKDELIHHKQLDCIEFFPIILSEIQKPETGQKTGLRTIRKILCANEPVHQKIFAYINLFSIRPLEVQKPETGQKTGPRTNWKFLWINQYENTNSLALKFFR